MRKTRCTLVVLGYGHDAEHTQPLTGGDSQMQPGRMITPASKAPPIVRGYVRARSRGMSGACRQYGPVRRFSTPHGWTLVKSVPRPQTNWRAINP